MTDTQHEIISLVFFLVSVFLFVLYFRERDYDMSSNFLLLFSLFSKIMLNDKPHILMLLCRWKPQKQFYII